MARKKKLTKTCAGISFVKKKVRNYDDVEELNCFFLCLECNIYCHCWMIKVVMQASPVLTVTALQMLRLMMKNGR